MTNRDLLVLLFAVVVGTGVGLVDVVLDLAPTEVHGVLNAALVIAVTWTFYKVGKASGPDD